MNEWWIHFTLVCLANFPANFKPQLKYHFLQKGFLWLLTCPNPIGSDSSILCLFLYYANLYYNSYNDSFKHVFNACLPSRAWALWGQKLGLSCTLLYLALNKCPASMRHRVNIIEYMTKVVIQKWFYLESSVALYRANSDSSIYHQLCTNYRPPPPPNLNLLQRLFLLTFTVFCLTAWQRFLLSPHPEHPHSCTLSTDLFREAASCHVGYSGISFLPQPNSLEGPEPTSADLLVDVQVHTLNAFAGSALAAKLPSPQWEGDSLVLYRPLLGMDEERGTDRGAVTVLSTWEPGRAS